VGDYAGLEAGGFRRRHSPGGASNPLLWFWGKGHHWMPGVFLPLAGVGDHGFQVVVEFCRVPLARLSEYAAGR